MILEYNNNTETISTVFRDTGLPYDSVLNFDKNTLITGINKIGDLLYWTCDNTFLSDTGETIHNEPKYINVEKGKAGFTIYYDGGDYSLGTPGTAFDIDIQYPYEFYVSDMDNSPNNAFVPAFRKRLYIDVCKKDLIHQYTFTKHLLKHNKCSNIKHIIYYIKWGIIYI